MRRLMFLIAFVACGSQAIKVMTGTFAACAQADLGQIIDGLPLETVIANILAANAMTLEAELGVVVAQVGIDAIDCAIAAIEAALPTAPATSTGGSAAERVDPSTGSLRLGIARAHAFVANYRDQKATSTKRKP
jgi:hypothetical protein